MQIVINISKSDYEKIIEDGECDYLRIINAIENGIPLPEGHGKLVDVNSIPEEDRRITVKGLLYPGTIASAGAIDLEEYVNNLPIIIEADTEGEDASID